MARYLIRRVLIAVGLIWIVLTIIFFALRLLPGDVTLAVSGERPASLTPEQRAILRHKLGLDRPVHIQYFDWLLKALQGDLGISLSSRRPVMRDTLVRIPRTIELAVAGLVVGVILGVPVGIIAALRRNTWLDRGLSAILVVLGSLPVYVSGIALILVFGLQLGWVPTGGFVAFSDDPWGHLRLLILPALTLGLWLGAIAARMTRSSLLEILSQDYIRTAHAKGLRPWKVHFGHALKNALIPVVTAIGLQVGALLGGAVLTETVFTWPGLGSAYVSAVSRRDYPVIQGVLIISVSAFILTNMVVDIAVGLLDPRVTYD